MTLLLILLALVALAALALAGLAAFTAWSVRRIEAGLPPQGRFVDVPGARLHVLEAGDPGKPALLMIHGLGGNLRHYSYGLVDALKDRFRVIAVDRPGAGWSVRHAGASAALSVQADAMAALIEALALPGPPTVVGHSLGGAVALALAQRHPDKVRALALIAPLTHTPSRISPVFDGLKVARRARGLIGWTLALPAAMARSEPMLAEVFGPEAVVPHFATRGGALLGMRPGCYANACADLADGPAELPAMTGRYAAMRCPVAVLYGRGDRLLRPDEQGETLAASLPGARLTLVDGGHMLPLTQVDATAAFIAAAAAG
ncbi:alpha/beta fold hydrolase [Pelomonas sp. KK5]|uniref:alpha/beta fold hydrolase n=1 Tax=Pelomonas sp. KK5 TaxID=1855730 RepID=UPI00097C5AF3|nr:alpha/beta hydrolase [Pelomonas sp. KK5]